MAAAKCNYLVVYENSPQVFSSSSLETILKSGPPKNCEDKNRSILFLTYFPDESEMKVFLVTDEEIEKELKSIEEKQLAKEKRDREKQQEAQG